MGDNFWFGYCVFIGVLFITVFSILLADASNNAQAGRCAANGLELFYGTRGTVCVDPRTHVLYAPHAADD